MTAGVTAFVDAVLRVVPPWLTRTQGARLLRGAIGDPLDAARASTVDAVRARFPTDDADPGALALIGRERRMRRGPQEPAKTYARRIRSWWDAHRIRGGPYALLQQLYAFWVDALGVRMDVVSQFGNRHWVSPTGVITHDAVTWGGNGDFDAAATSLIAAANPGDTEVRASLSFFPADRPFTVRLRDGIGGTELITVLRVSATPYDRLVLATPVVGTYPTATSTACWARAKWAHIWVFFYLTTLWDTLVTAADEVLVTEAGDHLIATSLFAGVITAADAEQFKLIPREWSAGHLPYVTVVLLYPGARCWGYPQPVPNWGDPGVVWQTSDPVILITDP